MAELKKISIERYCNQHSFMMDFRDVYCLILAFTPMHLFFSKILVSFFFFFFSMKRNI